MSITSSSVLKRKNLKRIIIISLFCSYSMYISNVSNQLTSVAYITLNLSLYFVLRWFCSPSSTSVSEFPLLSYTSSGCKRSCLLARAHFHRNIGRPSEICILEEKAASLTLGLSLMLSGVMNNHQKKNNSKTINPELL